MLWRAAAGKALKSIPWQLWAFLALVAAAYLYGEHRADSREDDVRAEYAEAELDLYRREAELEGKAKAIAEDTKADAQKEVEGIRSESTKIIERWRDVRIPCAMPDGLRDDLQAAADIANRGLPARAD